MPTFGNRRVLAWESDREMERVDAEGGSQLPMRFEKADDIDRPVMSQVSWSQRGRGFHAKTKEELQSKMSSQDKYHPGVHPGHQILYPFLLLAH